MSKSLKGSSEIVLSELEETILTLLSGDNTALYASQMVKAVYEASGDKRELKLSSLYPTLNRLAKKMLIEPVWAQETEETPPRKYYLLTNYGKEVIEKTKLFRNNIELQAEQLSQQVNMYVLKNVVTIPSNNRDNEIVKAQKTE